MKTPNKDIIAIIGQFLTDIGIHYQSGQLTQDTFLPGILIDQGSLIIDKEKLLFPGDLLHEAGHIAVTSAAERHLLQGNVTADNPQKDGDEIAVLLWTFAACQYLHLDLSVVFHPMGYKGESEWLIEQFTQGHYLGLPLLVWMGMTKAEEFPVMQSWLRA